MIEPFCCVVRSVGERTTAACRELLGQAIGGADRVTIVGHKPFPETLADSLRAGIAAGKPWTLCVDADVLPLPGAIAALMAEADALDDTIFEVQPVVLDRFFGGWRPAGVHLYRTSQLPRALTGLTGVASAIRPEASLLAGMAASGFAWRQLPLEFGLHDFEQAPSDVYRKCFVHAHKHADLKPALARYWRSRSAASCDFAVALEGLASGETHTGPLALDASAAYLTAPSSRPWPALPPLETADPAALLEAEERALAAMPRGVAPVWDWIDSDWAEMTRCRHTIDVFLRGVLSAGPRPCVVDEADARARILLQSAADWGIPISGIVAHQPAGRRFFRGVPMLDAAAPDARGTIRVRRNVDGRFTAQVNGNLVSEPRATELSEAGTSASVPELVGNLVQRLSAAGVTQMLVYGTGAAARELADAMPAGVVGFIESEPSGPRTAPGAAAILDPEQALEMHGDADVVIASLGSARAMVRRLLTAAAATGRWPRRIWLLDV